MTTTSAPPGLPTNPAAGTTASPASDGEANGPTPALTAMFAAMLDALTTELAVIAGERTTATDGQPLGEAALADIEPAGAGPSDVAVVSALAASPQAVSFVSAASIEVTGAGAQAGAARIDPIVTGPMCIALVAGGDVAGEATGVQEAAGGEPVAVPLRFEHPATSAGAPRAIADKGADGTEPLAVPATGTTDAGDPGLQPGSALHRDEAIAAATTSPVTDGPGRAGVDLATPLGELAAQRRHLPRTAPPPPCPSSS